jgi:hypothetical protein
MHFVSRVTLTALATSTVLAVGSPGAFRWLRLDFDRLPALVERLLYERERKERLAEQDAQVQARMASKRQLLLDLAAGRLSLAQAAARYRALSRGIPEVWDAVREVAPSGSSEEGLCRFVIQCVETEIDFEPGQRERVLCRLNAELDARLCSGAPLVGP